MIGQIKDGGIDDGNNTLTLEYDITSYIPKDVYIYKSNPRPVVFANNLKSNRIILELVFMSR